MTGDAVTLLPRNATAFERAVEQASGARWADLDAQVVSKSRDPWTCPAEFLPFLAFDLSVDLWNDDWDELKKRSVIAEAIAGHRLKGTEAGARKYLEIVGGEIVQLVTPPQAIFAAPNLTKEQWDAWIDRMPRLRVTFAHGEGEWTPPAGHFAGEAAIDVDFVALNDGPALYGRRAYLRTRGSGGEDIPLQLSRVEERSEVRGAVDFEQVVVPGVDANGTAAGYGAVGDAFVGAVGVASKIFTYALDREYVHRESELALTAVPVGLAPIETRYYRVSDTGEAGARAFADDGAVGADFVGVNDGGRLLADILYLLDSDAAAPLVDGLNFVEHSRIGMAPFTAEMLIDVPHTIPRQHALVGRGYVGDAALLEDDQRHIDAACDALAASKAERDRIAVSFAPLRQRSVRDRIPIDQPMPLGGYVPNSL